MDQPSMELIVDTKRLYRKDPRTFEQAVESIKNTTRLKSICRAADDLLKIARQEE